MGNNCNCLASTQKLKSKDVMVDEIPEVKNNNEVIDGNIISERNKNFESSENLKNVQPEKKSTFQRNQNKGKNLKILK